MTQRDQLKVIKGGFSIIRADLFRKTIKHKSSENLEWKTLEKGFKTKKAVLDRMKELLKSQNVIEG